MIEGDRVAWITSAVRFKLRNFHFLSAEDYEELFSSCLYKGMKAAEVHKQEGTASIETLIYTYIDQELLNFRNRFFRWKQHGFERKAGSMPDWYDAEDVRLRSSDDALTERIIVEQALARGYITKKQYIALKMWIEGSTEKETAEVIGNTYGAVQQLKRSGVRNIKKHMAGKI